MVFARAGGDTDPNVEPSPDSGEGTWLKYENFQKVYDKYNISFEWNRIRHAEIYDLTLS